MPEVHIERRTPAVPWWVWLVGALLLALLIWWIVATTTGDRRAAMTGPEERVAGTRQEAGAPEGGELLPVVVIVTNPTAYVGKPVSGTATVGEVVSDRGFWLREADGRLPDGSRLFTVIDEPTGETKKIDEGQRVRVSGIVYDAQRLGQVPGAQNLEADARQILEKEPAFLYVRAQDVTILEGQQAGAAAGAVSFAEILARPAEHIGRKVSGTANVVSDVSDRGFWMEENGARVFAVIDEPVPETIDINNGQRIRFSGTVMEATRAAQIPGVKALEKETRQILEQQPAFILVRATDITIAERPSR